jgi:hypothetical protein
VSGQLWGKPSRGQIIRRRNYRFDYELVHTHKGRGPADGGELRAIAGASGEDRSQWNPGSAATARASGSNSRSPPARGVGTMPRNGPEKIPPGRLTIRVPRWQGQRSSQPRWGRAGTAAQSGVGTAAHRNVERRAQLRMQCDHAFGRRGSCGAVGSNSGQSAFFIVALIEPRADTFASAATGCRANSPPTAKASSPAGTPAGPELESGSRVG